MDAVSQLDREWGSIATGALAEALARWQLRTPSLRRFATPNALLGFLQRAGESESDATLLVLLELAAEDRLAGRVVLQALLPALSEASRAVDPGGHRHELVELLLFHAWEAICSPDAPGAETPVAAGLARRVVAEGVRDLHRSGQGSVSSRHAGGRAVPACGRSALAQAGCEHHCRLVQERGLHAPPPGATRATPDRNAA